VRVNPLDHAIAFWKPLADMQELLALADYRDPDEPLLPGVNALRTDSEQRPYRVVHDGTKFSLFAAVHPIEDVPPSAEIVADILDRSGSHYSYVLWYPRQGSMVVPFDPNAAVESFWREEYVPPNGRTALPQPLLSLYYSVKPILPAAVRDRLRKGMARRAGDSEGFLEWPSDQSLDHLQRLLLRLVLMVSGRSDLQFAWFWPDERPWAAVLTHDVETADGLAHISHVVQMERQRGFRSSFNLVPLDYEVPGSLLRSLREDGFEIGVHGYTHDGLLFSKWRTFLERVLTINECGRQWNASGFRSPATYRNQEWFHLLGFEYDSSITDTAPYEPQPGGCASLFPFPIDRLIELPMTLPQDHTLFGLLGQTSSETWLTKLRQIKDANGMACVLTHPDPASGYIGLPENEAHYVDLLDAVAESEAWAPLPRDLARWWRARMLLPSAEAGIVKGVSYGRALLDPSGCLEIVPPSR
jgi:peptidoglycan/xylan/chitin deacetylase (PgdA/CDA1 family)